MVKSSGQGEGNQQSLADVSHILGVLGIVDKTPRNTLYYECTWQCRNKASFCDQMALTDYELFEQINFVFASFPLTFLRLLPLVQTSLIQTAMYSP